MPERLRDWDGKDLALVSGPAEIEQPLYSKNVHDEIVWYSPEAAASAFLGVAGVRATSAVTRDSGHWTARWQQGNRRLDLEFTLAALDGDKLAWGGTMVCGRSRLSDLLSLWLTVRVRLPAVWLHDGDCRMWTPAAFARKHGLLRLPTAFSVNETRLRRRNPQGKE